MLATLINYIVPAVLGWIAKSIHTWMQDYMAKKKAEEDAKAKDAAAIAAAESNDDTSGLFGGKRL